ncbi:retrovirus-related pol polyprotein from transposon TNT 1-94 [Tanacetum coccineum]
MRLCFNRLASRSITSTGSELTLLAGSELKTSELDSSKLKTSDELQVFEDLDTSELGKETLPKFPLISELSSLYPASYRVASKENGVNILKSIDEGLFQMGTFQETLAQGNEGSLHLGPERPRVYSDLSPEDKERGQGNNARGAGAAGYRGAQNRVGNANPGQERQVKCYNCNDIGHIARNCTQPKHSQNSEYFKDKMLLMQAQENRVALDEEQLLLITGGQDNAIDEDVDEQLLQDLALNVDNVFQADECNAFDYDVDEAPIAHIMFMASLSFVYLIYDETGPSYDSDILSEPALYNGHEIIKTNHVPAIVHNSEDTLEIAEITKKKMNDKMKDPECVKKKVKIAPHDYSKENYLATFTPQKQLTPEQIFWSKDLIKMKAEALKEQTTASRPIKALTVYPPNTPTMLVPRMLPTRSQVEINIFTLIQLFLEFEKTCKKRITPTGLTEGERGFEQTKECYLTEVIPFFKTLKEHFEGIQKALTKEIKEMKDIFEELEAEVDQNAINSKHAKIERKNILIANDNLIANCLSKDVFYIATNSELTVSRFTEMLDAHTIVQVRCLELEAELSNLRDKVQKDDHTELVKRFSNLEDHVKPTVLAPGKYAIDVEPIPPRNKNNREVHLDYLKHLKDSVETLRGVVEEAKVIQIVLWYLDSGCSKHMMGDRSRLRNFVKKFIRTVRLGNDHFGAIMGYGDYVIGESMISRVYYVEELGHNLFYVGQFYDSDLEVAFRKHSCYVRDTDGVELIKGSRGSNLYTILVEDMMKSSPICLLSKASKNKSWFWHRRLNHLNFGTINDLARKDLVRVPRTPQQNGVVKRRNRTLVKAARIMLIFSKALMFLWAEVVATPFFGALCYPTNDIEDLGKLQPINDIGIFVGYAPSRKGLVPNPVPIAPYVPPTNKELDILFQPMFDEYLEPPRVEKPVSPASAVPVPVNSAGVAAESTLMEDNPFTPVDNNPFINIFASEPTSEASSSGDVSSAESTYVTQTLHHLRKWSKDHPLDNVIGNPYRSVSTRKQLATDALWCLYNSVLSKVEPNNFKSAITEDCWFQAMQDEIHKIDRLQVWELVPQPDCVMIIALKWIYKIKLDE